MWLLPVDLAPYQIALPPGRYSLPWFYSDQQIERILQLLRGLLRGVSHHVELRWDPARGWPVERLGRADTAMVMLRGAAPTDPCTVALLGRYVFVQPERPDDAGVGWCERFIKTRLVSIARRVIADPNHPLAEMQLAKLPVDDAAAMTSDPIEFIELLEATIEHRFRYARFGLHDYDYRRSLRVVAGERLAAKLLTLPEEEQTPALELLLCGEPEDGDVSLAASALQRVGLAITVGPDAMLLPLARAAREFVVWGTLGVKLPVTRWSQRVIDEARALSLSRVDDLEISSEERTLLRVVACTFLAAIVYFEPLDWRPVIEEIDAQTQRDGGRIPIVWKLGPRDLLERLTSRGPEKSQADAMFSMQTRQIEAKEGDSPRLREWKRVLRATIAVLSAVKNRNRDAKRLLQAIEDARAVLDGVLTARLLGYLELEVARALLSKAMGKETSNILDKAEHRISGFGDAARLLEFSRIALLARSDIEAGEERIRKLATASGASKDFLLSTFLALFDLMKGEYSVAMKRVRAMQVTFCNLGDLETEFLIMLRLIVGDATSEAAFRKFHGGRPNMFGISAAAYFRNGDEVSAERIAVEESEAEEVARTMLAEARLRLGRIDEACEVLELEEKPRVRRILAELANSAHAEARGS